MALATPTVSVAGQPSATGGAPTTGSNNTNSGTFLPNNGNPFYNPGTYSAGGSAVDSQSFGGGGYGTAGTQPGGNNYPTGIYGPGPNGSGTALGTITPDELTSNQLTSLIGQNSPYIQQARNQALAQANSRGNINGSIAAGNAQGAAIQAALPIANANANTISGLQTTNLNNLSKAQTEQMAATAQIRSAGIGAAAQMNVAAQNNAGALLRQTDQNAFEGEQNELNYERTSALSNQQAQQTYNHDIGLDAFNLGSTLLTGQQNFYNQAGIAAMNDPAIMGDPASFGGYMQFVSGPFSNIIDSIFGNFGSMFGSASTGGNS